MSFLAPKWDAKLSQYTINSTTEYTTDIDNFLTITKDSLGSTSFSDLDALHNATDSIVTCLLEEGSANNWFSKLPSHEQLMKRIRHTFSKLSVNTDTNAVLTSVYMTPKLLTLVWTPLMGPSPMTQPPLCFEDSEAESEAESEEGVEPELQESALPVVELRDSTQVSREEYLLTRLRAAKARVEAEQMRIQYFETTGRMPPDSDSESEDD